MHSPGPKLDPGMLAAGCGLKRNIVSKLDKIISGTISGTIKFLFWGEGGVGRSAWTYGAH